MRLRNLYRFGFALTTALGNETRFINLRKYVDRDREVAATWAPISHYMDPDPYAHLPGPVHHQMILNRQARVLLDDWSSLDAVVVHAFQLYAAMSLRPRRAGRPVLALYQDYAPFRDPSILQQYGQSVRDTAVRRARFRLQAWFARRADLCLPWTEWAGRSFIEDCGVERQRVHVLSPGVDLELWPHRPLPRSGRQADRRLQILFVGGDFRRKGGEVLLRAYADLASIAELDIVTRDPVPTLPAGVRVHSGLHPNDQRLLALFRQADVLVLPTYAEMAGLVLMEAMATGRPVVASNVGGIPDIVEDGVTGLLVPAGDANALSTALRRLAEDPALRQRMGQAGRRRAELRFDAAANAARMTALLKAAVDRTSRRNDALAESPGG